MFRFPWPPSRTTASSIQEVGLLQPIVVRRVDGEDGETTYELIMGERRLRASKVAGLAAIPAVVRYTEDEDLLRDALQHHKQDL